MGEALLDRVAGILLDAVHATRQQGKTLALQPALVAILRRLGETLPVPGGGSPGA